MYRCPAGSSPDPAVEPCGRVYRYTVEGPKDFGLTNLRTVEDWTGTERLSRSWRGACQQLLEDDQGIRIEADLNSSRPTA